jgi:hypothetical protein
MTDISEILEVLETLDFEDYPDIFKACTSKFKDCEDDDIKSFIEAVNYDAQLCIQLLPHISSQEIIDEVNQELSDQGVSGFKTEDDKRDSEGDEEDKSEEEIPDEAEEVAESSNSSLEDLSGKSEDEILAFLMKNENNSNAYRHYLRFLSLETKMDYQISSLLERAHYHPEFCKQAIPLIKSDSALDFVLEKIPADIEVYPILIHRLCLDKKLEYQLVSLLETMKYPLEMCKACLPFLSSDENIFSVMKKTKYNQEVCSIALTRLRSFLIH